MDDELSQAAAFQIEGPDEDGCVWACSLKGDPEVWCRNLGPLEVVVEILSRWIESIAYDEREKSLSVKPELSLREVNDRLAKRSPKPRP